MNATNDNSKQIAVPCLPFHTILSSLHITTVDYFSLDVEGAEFKVLQTIPFDKLDIKTLSVEHKHGGVSKEEVIAYMNEQGYKLYKEIHVSRADIRLFVDDLFFVQASLMTS